MVANVERVPEGRREESEGSIRLLLGFFFSRRSRHTRSDRDWSSDVCSSDLGDAARLERDREFLFRHRYLLSAHVTRERFTAGGLRAAIGDSLDRLASPEGLLVKPLFARDPTGELLGIIDSLGPGQAPQTTEGVWSSPDGARALLLVQTRAAGSDTDAQQAACEAIRRAFAAVVAALPEGQGGALRLLMSGPPVFAVASRAIIKSEVVRLSSISAALIVALLLAVD